MMKATSLLLTLLSSTSALNVPLCAPLRSSSSLLGRTTFRLSERIDDFTSDGDNSGENDDGSDGSTSSFAQSLSQRITQLQQNESSFVAGLQKRVKSVAKAEEFDSVMTGIGDNDDGRSREPVLVELPVICFDALLPNQRLAGSTTDPTFCNFLRSFGLGGTFVMTSLNNRQRKLRRFGVVARIELVDVDDDDSNEDSLFSAPTAVTFIIAGKRRCEILGPADGMKDRIGRWRRSYDPDGEESMLGWGDERFVDNSCSVGVDRETIPGTSLDCTRWSSNEVLIIDEESEAAEATSNAIAKATYLIPLIERWIALASDQTTYDNVDVVARTRRKSGEPGLSVNASALISKVQKELGPMPSPQSPTSFAVWGAALINPLPALGVATELRGAVLEADGPEKKLAVLERGLIKSINNLDGTRPLNM